MYEAPSEAKLKNLIRFTIEIALTKNVANPHYKEPKPSSDDFTNLICQYTMREMPWERKDLGNGKETREPISNDFIPH